MDTILSSPSRKDYDAFTQGIEHVLLIAQLEEQDLHAIRLNFKEEIIKKDKCRRYTIGKGPIKVRDGLKQIVEKDARRAKKSKVIINVSEDEDDDLPKEMRGFGFGLEDMAAVPDPLDLNADYLPL